MKKIYSLIAILALTFSANKIQAVSIEDCTLDCSGCGTIETSVEELEDDEFLFGLRYEADSAGHHQYYFRLKISDQKHYISKNRIALIKFDAKANQPIMELKAAYQVSGTKRVKSWQYKFQQNWGGVVSGANVAAAGVSMMDEDDRYNVEPLSNTYYPISDEQLQILMNNSTSKLRFDTGDKVLEVSGKNLNNVIKESYEEIQKCLTKDVHKDF